MNTIDENKSWYKKFARSKGAKYLKLFLVIVLGFINIGIYYSYLIDFCGTKLKRKSNTKRNRLVFLLESVDN